MPDTRRTAMSLTAMPITPMSLTTGRRRRTRAARVLAGRARPQVGRDDVLMLPRLLQRAAGEHLAFRHYHHLVGRPGQEGHVVRYQQHGHPARGDFPDAARYELA